MLKQKISLLQKNVIELMILLPIHIRRDVGSSLSDSIYFAMEYMNVIYVKTEDLILRQYSRTNQMTFRMCPKQTNIIT